MRDVESIKSVHCQARNQPKICKTDASVYAKFQSFSLEITSMPKFGEGMACNTNNDCPNWKMEWPLERIASTTSRGAFSKVKLHCN